MVGALFTFSSHLMLITVCMSIVTSLKLEGKKLNGLTCPRESQGSDLAVCL